MAESKGKINAYICENLHTTVTRNADEGVTPMFIRCGKCRDVANSRATSLMYCVNQSKKPTHEWHKPGEKDLQSLKENMEPELFESLHEHVKQGGLLLRELPEQFPDGVAMRRLGDIIAPEVDGFIFALFVYPKGKEGYANYISNGDREDMILVLEEKVAKFKAERTFRTPENN